MTVKHRPLKWDKICLKPTKKYPKGREGTEAGERAHRVRGEEPCDKCREGRARRARERQQKKMRKYYDSSSPLVCEHTNPQSRKGKRGTATGYKRHVAAGQDPCIQCLNAYREYTLGRYHQNKGSDRERKVSYQEKYRQENRERIRARDRLYYQVNRDLVLARGSTRRNQMRYTYDGWEAKDIAEQHGTTCHLCNDEVDLAIDPRVPHGPHVEHVFPLSHPDTPGNVLSNVRWSHNRCNLKKGRKLMEELDLPFPSPVPSSQLDKSTEEGEQYAS